MIRLLLVVLMLCLLVAPPATGEDMPNQLVDLARWAGVPADVQLLFIADSDQTEYNGSFISAGTYCIFDAFCQELQTTVTVIAGSRVPPEILRYVILHEIGHYYQWRLNHNAFRTRDTKPLEQEADVFAVNALCAHGEDGVAIFEEARGWNWVVNGKDYSDDESHGSSMERIAHVRAYVTLCQGQAP